MSGNVSALAVLVNKALIFALLFVLAKLIGVAAYGVFSYYYAIVTGVASVMGECVALALCRYALQQGVRADYLTYLKVAVMSAIIAGLTAVMAVALFPSDNESNGIIGLAVLLGSFGFAVSSVLNVVITGLMFTKQGAKTWALAQLLHGISVFAGVIAAAYVVGSAGAIFCALAFFNSIAPAIGLKMLLATVKKARAIRESDGYLHLVVKTGMPEILGGMLFGAPIHIICIMIFNKFSNSLEVGYFNLYFLFYVILTVVPASLAPYILAKLASGTNSQKLYIGFGIATAIVAPALLYVTQSLWLCNLGSHVCQRSDILPAALIAGGVGLVVTQLVQVVHSAKRSGYVVWSGIVYAAVYLTTVGVSAAYEALDANRMFYCFLSALIVQVAFLSILLYRLRDKRQSCLSIS